MNLRHSQLYIFKPDGFFLGNDLPNDKYEDLLDTEVGDKMKAIFVQIKCATGQAYDVANDIVDNIEQTSEVFSTSGQYDLIAKFYLKPE